MNVVALREGGKPRRADRVAKLLRDRILSGALSEGDMLPKQEELISEFGVSLPCMREVFRILETEGLITVIRGNVGGAIVHPPNVAAASYMMGLVLQSKGAPLRDLSNALAMLEPLCTVACAQREDRATAVLPRLREILDQAEEAIDDADAFVRLAREFHTTIVLSCGNESIALAVGVLERLWTAQVQKRSEELGSFGVYSDRATRLAQALGHERIYRAIADGDPEGVRAAIQRHQTLAGEDRHYAFDAEKPITVSEERGA
jgi:GntR family transcriptional repressor for pyruvate dehydrogenase complex